MWTQALIKKKKEKENVLIDLKLNNLKSAFLFNYEEFIKNTANRERKVGGGK
jgi:hypothetical protein